MWPKKKIISRDDGTGKPYLIRYNFFECRWFSIKLHRILQDDRDCMHDHPWAFWSIILKGGYYEFIPFSQMCQARKSGDYKGVHCIDGTTGYNKWFPAGSFLRRPANWIHRLELPIDPLRTYVRGSNVLRPALTLVITLKKTREWGFWTKVGWIPWEKYHAKNTCE